MKNIVKIISIILSLILLTSSLFVQAETPNEEYQSTIKNNIQLIMSDIFSQDNESIIEDENIGDNIVAPL